MPEPLQRKSIGQWNDQMIAPGEGRDVKLAISESYSGMTVRIPLHIRRARREGPTIFITAALHGDEINGTGAVRRLVQDGELKLKRGALILVPVLNLLGFDRHSRYLPDRRDLNRSFPGSLAGSLASRMARTIFNEIVSRCDYGIDLHTAAAHRTNYPNVRADLNDSKVRRIAKAFGADVVVNGRGPKGAFRREACNAGVPTIIMEGGEVCKVEPSIVESAVRGVKNVLRELNMIEGEPERRAYQAVIQKTKWIRAERGGFLQFHVQPGEILETDQALATNTNLLGHEKSVLYAPFDSIVLGMTTLPAVSPGEPVCHLARLPQSMKPARLRRLRSKEGGWEGQIVDQLATNVLVTDPTDEPQA